MSAIIGGCIGFGGVALLDENNLLFAPLYSTVPPKALDLVAAIGLLALLYTLLGLFRRRKQLQPSASRQPLRRPAKNAGARMLVWQLTFAFVLFVLVGENGWTYESVGFRNDLPVLISLGLGVSLYMAFVLLLQITLRLSGALERVLDGNMLTIASIYPRHRRQKIYFLIGVCVLNPIIEELMFRGILVHQFSLAIGNFGLPVAIGLAANLGIHAYQGRTAITTHLPFYLIAVGLLYSPAGLTGAIGFHIAGDVFPFVLLKRDLCAYGERHRRTRPAHHQP